MRRLCSFSLLQKRPAHCVIEVGVIDDFRGRPRQYVVSGCVIPRSERVQYIGIGVNIIERHK